MSLGWPAFGTFGVLMDPAIWEEPVHGSVFPPELFGLSGLEQLRLLQSGEAALPPVHHLTGMRLTELGAGTATLTMPITGWLQTPQGITTAGVVAILADGPLGCAIQTTLPPATGYTTAEMSINMVRPVPGTGQLIARGTVVHCGRQLGLSETFVTDGDGRLIAHGTSRCVIFPPAAGVPSPPAGEIPLAPVDDGDWTPPFERAAAGLVLGIETWKAHSGLEILRAQLAGNLPYPPIHHLLGVRLIEVDRGTSALSMPATGWVTSPTGLVEGGVIACLADLALAAAVQTTVPAGTAYAPTDLRTQFIRPIPPDGSSITARASVVHRGRRIAVTRAEVTNEERKLLALASSSAVILPGRRADLADAPPD